MRGTRLRYRIKLNCLFINLRTHPLTHEVMFQRRYIGNNI